MAELRTMGQVIKYTFDHHIPWLSGNGSKAAYYNCQHFFNIFGRQFPATSVDVSVIEKLKTDLHLQGKSNATINRVISALSTALKFCYRSKKIAQPMDFKGLKLPEKDAVRLHYEPDQIKELVDAARTIYNDNDLADIIIAAFTTGFRQSELLEMRVRDVNFSVNGVVSGKRRDGLTGDRKGGDVNYIPISSWLLPILKERCRDQPPTAFVFGEDWLNRHELLRRFTKVRMFCGYKESGYCFHSLRHSFGTFQMQIGTAPRDVMSMMGHANIETTLRYAKSTDKAKKAAISQMDSALPFLN